MVVDDDLHVPSVTRDRNDDTSIALAEFAHADYLVSGDPDPLVLKEFEGIPIVSPAEFVAILNAQ